MYLLLPDTEPDSVGFRTLPFHYELLPSYNAVVHLPFAAVGLPGAIPVLGTSSNLLNYENHGNPLDFCGHLSYIDPHSPFPNLSAIDGNRNRLGPVASDPTTCPGPSGLAYHYMAGDVSPIRYLVCIRTDPGTLPPSCFPCNSSSTP